MKRLLFVLIAIVVVAGIVFAAFSIYGSVAAPVAERAAPAIIPPTTLSFDATYAKGTHTIEGEVSVDTPCMTIEATSTVSEAGTIRIDIMRMRDDGVCLQLPTEKEFSLDVSADEDAAIEAYVDGLPVENSGT